MSTKFFKVLHQATSILLFITDKERARASLRQFNEVSRRTIEHRDASQVLSIINKLPLGGLNFFSFEAS